MLLHEYTEQTRFPFWYSQLKGLDIPMPESIVISAPEELMVNIINQEPLDPKQSIIYNKLLEEIDRSVTSLEGYPAFIKTDLVAGKHASKPPCFLNSKEDIDNSVISLIEESYLGPETAPKYFIVRKLLKLESKFKAFGGLPISKERRVFIKDRQVEDIYPYWPKESILFWKSRGIFPIDNWEALLEELNTDSIADRFILQDYGRRIGRVLTDYWSLDFAKDITGKWWLIDAARGEISWKPS